MSLISAIWFVRFIASPLAEAGYFRRRYIRSWRYPAALVITMFGLGLTLTTADLVRVGKAPKAAVIALLCQLLVLPAIAFGLVVSFGLAPELAVGMMLLAASPGGASASLFSHLAGGDVALNIAVTAINSIIALVTFPIIAEVSMAYFLGEGQSIGLQADKLIQIFVAVVGNETMAIPPAVYGILMYFPVALVAYLFARRTRAANLADVSGRPAM